MNVKKSILFERCWCFHYTVRLQLGTKGPPFLLGHSELLAVSTAKAVPLFFNYFQTLSVVPALRIETKSSRSVVRRTTASAIPAAVA